MPFTDEDLQALLAGFIGQGQIPGLQKQFYPMPKTDWGDQTIQSGKEWMPNIIERYNPPRSNKDNPDVLGTYESGKPGASNHPSGDPFYDRFYEQINYYGDPSNDTRAHEIAHGLQSHTGIGAFPDQYGTQYQKPDAPYQYGHTTNPLISEAAAEIAAGGTNSVYWDQLTRAEQSQANAFAEMLRAAALERVKKS